MGPKIYGKVSAGNTQLRFNVFDPKGVHAVAKMPFGPLKATGGKTKGAKINGNGGIVGNAVLGVLEQPDCTMVASVGGKTACTLVGDVQGDVAKLEKAIAVGFSCVVFRSGKLGAQFGGYVRLKREL